MNLNALDWIEFCNKQKTLSKIICTAIYMVGGCLMAYGRLTDTALILYWRTALLFIAAAFGISGVEPWCRNKYSHPAGLAPIVG